VLLDRRDGLLADLDRSDPETAAATAAITATPTAAAPPGAASAAASAAAAAASAVPATAVPTFGGELYAGRMCSGVFLVEDIESRQADVEDLFLTESNYVTRCSVLRRYIFCGADDCRGCAAPQR
jgi:TPP-dependent trihydroxycyclohexane-1,2-dione (THcHDO) dehydratase